MGNGSRPGWFPNPRQLVDGITQEPTEWTLRLAHLTLVLHRAADAHPMQWFGTCEQAGIAMYPVGASGLAHETAKTKLILHVEGKLSRMHKDIVGMIP